MRFSGRLLTALTAMLAALSLSGCLALAVPSLAYQGYKYEKDKKQQDQQASSQTTKSKNSSSSDQYYDTE